MLIFGGKQPSFGGSHTFFFHVRTDYLSLHLISLLSFCFFLLILSPKCNCDLQVPLSLLRSPVFPAVVSLQYQWLSPIAENAPSSPKDPGGSQSIDPWPKPIRGPAVQGATGFKAFIKEKKHTHTHKERSNQLKTRVHNRRNVHQELLKLLWSF